MSYNKETLNWRLKMEQLFITNLTINKVRHLKDLTIPLSEKKMKALILTGKNGSGKTSVTDALASYLEHVFTDKNFEFWKKNLHNIKKKREEAVQKGADETQLLQLDMDLSKCEMRFHESRNGMELQFNIETDSIFLQNEKHHYILAYYRADRTFQAALPQHVEKVPFKDSYGIKEFPRYEFVKYLLDLKMTEALARNNRKTEKADEIQEWFERLEQLLQQIFDDESVQLEFDEETFNFYILQKGKEIFDFNTLSSGYQAVLDIVLDLIMRMQKQTQRKFDFKVPGIVLIDEIETHLHLQLQKNIMPLLTTVFPNIQFIVTSHSPFILNSLENAVIYDLEHKTLVENGLHNVPYEGIVEGYFRVDKMSDILKRKFEKYESLVKKKYLSDDEISEIAKLELYLDEIPDYLAIGTTAAYQKLKLEFLNREDIDG